MIRRSAVTSFIYALPSVLVAGLGAFVAWNHPLGGVVAIISYSLFFAIGMMRVPYWLVLVPAALPIVDLAPWSGWFTFEEFDLLVLALASGAYVRLAIWGGAQLSKRSGTSLSFGAMIISVFFVASVAISMFRGFDDAGGFSFGWYQGYYEPMNSVRLGKSFFLALYLLPLWLHSCRVDQQKAMTIFAVGMAGGLGFASLAAIWERMAYTGLLDFSSDYRTTALFWEMHVGGAALDGFLVLTLPFAIWAFIQARSSRYLVFFGIVLALASYACLTTFSRGVYLAIPVGLALMAWLMLRNSDFKGSDIGKIGGVLPAFLLTSFFGGAAIWIFPTSGYRGMLAICMSVALFYPVSLVWGSALPSKAWWALIIGLATAVFVAAMGYFVPKGAYFVFALGATLTGVALRFGRGGVSFPLLSMVLTGYMLALAGCISIAFHWGGEEAVDSMATICLMLLIGMLSATRIRPLPELKWHWHAGLLCTMLLIGISVATFSGGRYMSERFSTSEKDMATRLQHWEAGLGQMDSMDWLLGKGLGRYPASHFFAAPGSEHPGGYRLVEEKAGSYLLLSGGQHTNGWGEIFRVTQRVSPGKEPYSVKLDVRAESDVRLHFEICEKHLLYNAACVFSQTAVRGQPGIWQNLDIKLAGSQPTRGAWYAPKLIAFSVAMETRGGMAHIDNLGLYDGFGENLVVNGDFSNGMAHWFSSSDRHHMPWHMKSLLFHTLFDQGLLGALILALIVLAVFWRLTAGGARLHPMAPAVVGGVAGFLVVGLFDSLLDVPRLATLFYLVLMIGLFANVKTGKRLHSGEKPKHHDSASQGI